MKYVLTGAAGKVTKLLAEKLLAAGHEVTVIGRNAGNLKPLTDKGAKAAIGSVEDVAFLTQTFTGADAVYTMVPPNFGATDWKSYIGSIGKNYAEAIRDSGVKYVVNLSSVGAHMPEGCGPVSGLYRSEQALNVLTDVAIKHMRPGFFYQNMLTNIDMVKHMNIIGGNYGGKGNKIIMSDVQDVADAVAEELTNLNFKGHTIRYISSDERSGDDIAKALGNAVEKPQLPWIEFTDEQSLNGMQQAGVPAEIAKNYVEMGMAMRNGSMFADYETHRPTQSGNKKLEDFAQQFAGAYKAV